MTSRLEVVLAAIDSANAADPTQEDGHPSALLYGQRMSAELDRLGPSASEHLRIAVRGQHVERWKVPRTSFPDGRAGYLAWRAHMGREHAERVSGMMAEAGYGEADRARVATLLRKEGIKRNPETQMLEDVACFVFLRWYAADFAARHAPADVARIVGKTLRKMSAEARARAEVEFALQAPLEDPLAP